MSQLTQDKINEWKDRLENLFQDMEHFITPYDEKRFINFIETLLKEQREELISKLEEYKMYYNPIGDDINKGRRLACDDFINLIKDK